MKGRPLPVSVSVVMPTFNTGPYLHEAVQSVLRQQPGDYDLRHVLVVDDNSTDPAALSLLDEVAAMDPRIRVLRNARQKGSGGARNHGVLNTDADWIAFLDSDDVFLEDALTCRVAVLRQYPDAGWIGADFIRCDMDLKPVEGVFLATKPKTAPVLYGDDAAVSILRQPLPQFINQNLAFTGAVMVRRDRFMAAGMFDESLRRAQDYNLWLRLAMQNDYVFVRRPVAYYRTHPNSITASGSPRAWGIRALEAIRNYPQVKPYRKLMDHRLADFYHTEIRYQRHLGHAREAFRYLRRGLIYAAHEPVLIARASLEAMRALITH